MLKFRRYKSLTHLKRWLFPRWFRGFLAPEFHPIINNPILSMQKKSDLVNFLYPNLFYIWNPYFTQPFVFWIVGEPKTMPFSARDCDKTFNYGEQVLNTWWCKAWKTIHLSQPLTFFKHPPTLPIHCSIQVPSLEFMTLTSKKFVSSPSSATSQRFACICGSSMQ